MELMVVIVLDNGEGELPGVAGGVVEGRSDSAANRLLTFRGTSNACAAIPELV